MRSPSPPDDSGPAYDVVTVLRDERARRVTHVAALQRSMGELVAASDNSDADDEHDPEGATIAFERSQLSAQLEAAQTALDEVAHPLDRVRDGSYGICRVCGRPIAAARLGARPTATACVTCALIRR
ncbi:MAG: TraR/DksA C4-type zinc finger protein [Spirochaetaceae bacterium]|nr:TraR/DksA C4-type zinc finger protein [Spirochaetaceae bacterium]